jgi:L-asparaginase
VPHFAVPASLPEVAMVVDYPGNDGRLLDAAVADGAGGIVVVGYGIGNVSKHVFAAVKRARAKGIPVLLATRAKEGRIYPAYGGDGGGASMRDLGVVFGTDVSPWKQRILLMLALGETSTAPELEAILRRYR